MSGGSASDATRELFTREGPEALARTLDWLGGKRADLIASRQVAWDDDPWARGGYAFFDPAFDPALRSWLARPAGRLFFAGDTRQPVAGLHERRHRERPPRRGGSRGRSRADARLRVESRRAALRSAGRA
jgi:hypothetical protein